MDIQIINTQHCSICSKITKASNAATSRLCWLISHREARSYWVAKETWFWVSPGIKSHNPNTGNGEKFASPDKTFCIIDWRNFSNCSPILSSRLLCTLTILNLRNKFKDWIKCEITLQSCSWHILSGLDWKIGETTASVSTSFSVQSVTEALMSPGLHFNSNLAKYFEKVSILSLYCKQVFI